MADLPPAAIQETLEVLREQKGWSWADLARALQVDQSVISAICNGRRRFTTKFANRLAEHLECSTEDIFREIAKRTNEATLREMRERTSRNLWLGHHYMDFVGERIGSLSGGDTYVLITSETPLEFDFTRLVDKMLPAANKGARFRYVFPQPPSDTDDPKDTAASAVFGQYLIGCGGYRLRDQFDLWLRRIDDEVHRRKLTAVNTQDAFQATVATWPAQQIFFAPYIKYVLIDHRKGTRGRDRLDTEAWIEILYETSVTESRCFLKLPGLATRLLADWLKGLEMDK